MRQKRRTRICTVANKETKRAIIRSDHKLHKTQLLKAREKFRATESQIKEEKRWRGGKSSERKEETPGYPIPIKSTARKVN